MPKTNVEKSLVKLLQTQTQTIGRLKELIEPTLLRVIEILAKNKGILILSGMGKSGLICQKITATLNSTGTRALYLHPSDALHGDIGVMRRGDYILVFSHSGETREILSLIASARRLGAKVIAVSGNRRSTIVHLADHPIVYPFDREGSPHNLAPMASTTAMLVIGDMIATGLMVHKGFTVEDFAQYHPAGSLGKEIATFVEDVMIKEPLPIVDERQTFKDMIQTMVSTNLGALVVCTAKQRVVGIISDGDIKRVLNRYTDYNAFKTITAKDIMTKNPITALPKDSLRTAMEKMQKKVVYVLPVVQSTKNQRLIGMIRMHDILSFRP